MKAIVFDTETTGIPRHPNAKMEVQPRAIEFGAVIVDEEGESLAELEMLFNPGIPLEPIITKITGLTDEILAPQPTFGAQLPALMKFFEGCDAVIAHNLPFDHTIIELEMERLGRSGEFPWPRIKVCTVQENAERWGRRAKLTELYEEVEGEKLDQKHRALDDVYALVKVAKETGVLRAINSTLTS